MDQDIKRIKDQDQQEDLEKEVVEVKTGKIDIPLPTAAPEVIEEAPVEVPADKIAASPDGKERGEGRGGGRFGRKRTGGREGGGRDGGRRGRGERKGEETEFEQKIIDLARVTRVMAGGKRMRFRACVVIGDRKGKVGLGLAKGKDVTMAISKAVIKARKDMVTVPFVKETIPFLVEQKFKAARILMKPAKKGKGIIAGGALRVVFELAGIPNVVAKILGTNNKVNNAKATILAFKKLSDYVAGRKNKVKAAKPEVK